MKPYYESNGIIIYVGDCREIMPQLDFVHAIITDPPYGLEFMGKDWDAPWKTDRRQNFDGTLQDQRGNPYGRSKVRNGTGASYGADARIMQEFQRWCESWASECLRVLRPGGHMLSFGGSRTYHRMACAIEDAGFEIRDQIMWLYGSGFPKSLDVSKTIDKAARGVPQGGSDPTSPSHGKFKGGCSEDNPSGRGFGAGPGHFMAEAGQKSERELVEGAKQWQGWGTALKPAHEPICVARKPLEGTVAANVQQWGTGALNIDGCRVGIEKDVPCSPSRTSGNVLSGSKDGSLRNETGDEGGHNPNLGRWPANVIHDGSEEVVSFFPDRKTTWVSEDHKNNRDGDFLRELGHPGNQGFNDSGSAARFFYTAKADRNERGVDNNHPTVKPLDLMAYLCKLICPPSGGILLDPFMGSGSTLIAGRRFYQQCIGIEMEERYAEIAAKRLSQEVLQF